MSRYNSFITTIQPDFWRDKFKPRDLMRIFAHIQSVLSSRSDMKLLETYDIQKLPEHTVGYTRTWVPIQIAGETYLGDNVDYPWLYAIVVDGEIDSDWLYIDAIYDSHVDPEYTFQVGIDFKYLDGIIQFRNKVPSDVENLYVSKGQYAGYRIRNEIGSLLRYERKDSKFYRDAIEPVMVSFYKGPTTRHIVAMLNIAFGLPVTKYESEVVESVVGDVVTTDKYTYTIPANLISVKNGDILHQFDPLTNAINIITHETHPNWWEDKPPDLFQKYVKRRVHKLKGNVPATDTRTYEEAPGNYREVITDGVGLTAEERNKLLTTFLKDVILYIEISVDSVNVDAFTQSQDLLDLFYDALPTRTDPILSKIATPRDTIDEIHTPDVDTHGVGLQVHTMYGLNNTYGQYGVYSPDLGRPTFLADTENDTVLNEATGLYEKPQKTPTTFVIGTYRWHIFNQNDIDNFKEFWKYRGDKAPIFEPHISKVYGRFVVDKPWTTIVPDSGNYYYDLEIESPTIETIQVGYGGSLVDLTSNDIVSTSGSVHISNNVNIKPYSGSGGYFEDLASFSNTEQGTCKDLFVATRDIVSVQSYLKYYYDDIATSWSYDTTKIQKTAYSIRLQVQGTATLDNSTSRIYVGSLPKNVTVSTTYSADYTDNATIALTWSSTGDKYQGPKASTSAYLSIYKSSTTDEEIDDLSVVEILNVSGYLTLKYTLTSTGESRPEIRRVIVKLTAI